MKILYILGNGSPFQNEELRYSLRSVEKYIPSIEGVVVVGENPGFLSDEVEYHYVREISANKEARIAFKILEACKMGAVQGKFLFFNDDFLVRLPIEDPENYPYYHRGDLPNYNGGGHYRKALYHTWRYLTKRRLPAKHFDVHNPIIYDQERFISLETHWEASRSIYSGMVVKSLYSNMFGIPGIYRADLKMSTWNSGQTRLGNREIFSYSDAGWRHGVGQWARKEFPDKSRFEK